ncbi:hypothetical protein F5Y15DRAFT_431280 [Xylariaceae sp. FL0016]|nr:hypothetical protein F5Y15DRAFT_431280 [Xylariaceae sp. FL0016]
MQSRNNSVTSGPGHWQADHTEVSSDQYSYFPSLEPLPDPGPEFSPSPSEPAAPRLPRRPTLRQRAGTLLERTASGLRRTLSIRSSKGDGDASAKPSDATGAPRRLSRASVLREKAVRGAILTRSEILELAWEEEVTLNPTGRSTRHTGDDYELGHGIVARLGYDEGMYIFLTSDGTLDTSCHAMGKGSDRRPVRKVSLGGWPEKAKPYIATLCR